MAQIWPVILFVAFVIGLIAWAFYEQHSQHRQMLVELDRNRLRGPSFVDWMRFKAGRAMRVMFFLVAAIAIVAWAAALDWSVYQRHLRN